MKIGTYDGSVDVVSDAGLDAGAKGVAAAAQMPDDLSIHYLKRNRCKQAITLNLKAAEGVELFRQLVAKADVVGAGHVRCFLSDSSGGRLKAIAFRAAGEPLGDALLDKSGLGLQLAGKLRPDTWQGRDDVQLIIDYAAQAAS